MSAEPTGNGLALAEVGAHDRVVPGTIELISSDPLGRTSTQRWRWRCSCGRSSGGRWYRSAEEASKAAHRHVDRCPQP
jgi:hypothetical protein